jgi:hypothetical protein
MYQKIDILERDLEELVRLHPHLIEEGLVYVTHQSHTGTGRLDVLLVDSGKALVVAELKVVEDDAMLTQCLDYFDHVSTGIETYARLHRAHEIDPSQPVRMLLIAPSFSQTLVNRCKWIDASISLFRYTALRLDGQVQLIPVYFEQSIPSPQEAPVVHRQEDRLGYITDATARARAAATIDWARTTWGNRLSVDPIKYSISLKVDNKVIAYVSPRRKSFLIYTYTSDDKWTPFTVQSDDDLENPKSLVQAYADRRIR